MASLSGMTLVSSALTVCIIWGVTIATLDLITFRIYNSALLMGVFLVWPALFLIGQSFNLSLAVLAFTLVVLATGLTSLLGMGDVKLLLFAAPWLQIVIVEMTASVAAGTTYTFVCVLADGLIAPNRL
jgi:hypothetical protein